MNQTCPYCNIELPLAHHDQALFEWHLGGHEEKAEPLEKILGFPVIVDSRLSPNEAYLATDKGKVKIEPLEKVGEVIEGWSTFFDKQFMWSNNLDEVRRTVELLLKQQHQKSYEAGRVKAIKECIEMIGKLPVPRPPDNKQNQIIRRLGDLLIKPYQND